MLASSPVAESVATLAAAAQLLRTDRREPDERWRQRVQEAPLEARRRLLTHRDGARQDGGPLGPVDQFPTAATVPERSHASRSGPHFRPVDDAGPRDIGRRYRTTRPLRSMRVSGAHARWQHELEVEQRLLRGAMPHGRVDAGSVVLRSRRLAPPLWQLSRGCVREREERHIEDALYPHVPSVIGRRDSDTVSRALVREDRRLYG